MHIYAHPKDDLKGEIIKLGQYRYMDEIVVKPRNRLAYERIFATEKVWKHVRYFVPASYLENIYRQIVRLLSVSVSVARLVDLPPFG